MTGVLSTITPCEDDLCIGIVQYFILHTPHIRPDFVTSDTPMTNLNSLKKHILAKVFLLQYHPRKLSKYRNSIIMAATVYDSPSSAEYIPVSRIISRYAVVNCTLRLNYGEDKVTIAVPLRIPL